MHALVVVVVVVVCLCFFMQGGVGDGTIWWVSEVGRALRRGARALAATARQAFVRYMMNGGVRGGRGGGPYLYCCSFSSAHSVRSACCPWADWLYRCLLACPLSDWLYRCLLACPLSDWR
jgi:hypothetical protein